MLTCVIFVAALLMAGSLQSVPEENGYLGDKLVDAIYIEPSLDAREALLRDLRSTLQRSSKQRFFPYYKGLGK